MNGKYMYYNVVYQLSIILATSVISPTVNPTSRSTHFLNPLLWTVIVTIIVVALLLVIASLMVVFCITYLKRQNESDNNTPAKISK